MKIIASLGPLEVLEDLGLLKNIEEYTGSSAGAIISFLLVIGYTILEIIQLTINIDFSKNIIDIKIRDFFINYGLDSGDKLYNLFKIFSKAKDIDENITFQQLYEINNKNLTIVATCINTSTSEYFNYINFPDVKVLDALRASCSIPFIFAPFKIGKKHYIDGCVCNTFPITKYNPLDSSIIGIVLDKQYVEDCESNILYSVIKSIIENQEINLDEYGSSIIRLRIDKCADFASSINFEMTQKQKEKLIIEGKKNTIEFIEKIMNEELEFNKIDDIKTNSEMDL